MIVSAEVKLIPSPPARVERRKIFDFPVKLLKESMILYLSMILVVPSNLS
jgi:hypothetical protein